MTVFLALIFIAAVPLRVGGRIATSSTIFLLGHAISFCNLLSSNIFYASTL